MTDNTEMSRVRHGAEIDLSRWEWGEHGFAALVIQGAAVRISEVLRGVFKESPPQLDFPIGWSPASDGVGGKPPEDPVTLYVSLPLGPDENENVYYALSLESCIDELIELHQPRDDPGKVTDEEGRGICHAVAARLRELADKLDAACKETP